MAETGLAWSPPAAPSPCSPFPRVFLAARQDWLAHVIREVDAKAWESWGCVFCFVAMLDSPFLFQHMGGCSEKCKTNFLK